MDGSQYHSNGMSNNSPYSTLPNISPHQLSNNGPAHTLPPLQPQQHAMMYSTGAHTPRTPSTPNAPQSNMNFSQQQMGNQQRNYPPPPQMGLNGYQQQQQPPPYRTSTSGSMSTPQAIAPAPPQNRGMQQLAPMPVNGLGHLQPGMSPYGQHGMMGQGMMEEQPTHVVGSQGRRGILPSAPGRPTVAAAGTTAGKNALIPAKDADGKFPCPHCTKTYLHAKHLKRHLLRHTGDRPYMCVLCRDTFSRSDILKRHFQKCSIRRGNPTGASHLSHAQAHLKKSHPGSHKNTPSMSNENGMMNVNGMSMDPALQPFGVIADGSVPDAGSGMSDEQAAQEQLARENNMKRYSADGGRNGLGPGMGNSARAGFNQNYAGGIASTMPSGMNPPTYGVPNGQNLHSYSQNYDTASNGSHMSQSNTPLQTPPNGPALTQAASHSNGQRQPEWSPMYQPTNHDRFTGANYVHIPQIPQNFLKQEQNIGNGLFIKPESNATNALFPGVYPGVSNHGSEFPSWNFQSDPLQQISNRLQFLCFPTNSNLSNRNASIKHYLSSDNIKHFLEHFTSFHGHFPIIHMPTFRITEANDGLLLSMICVGAVYSERISPSQVRDLIDLVKSVIESSCKVFSKLSQANDNGYTNGAIGWTEADLEEIAAIFFIQSVQTWHGNPIQRQQARDQYPRLIALARSAGLTQPVTKAPLSALHQPHIVVEHFNAANFDWNAWVIQERRSRLMYGIFLVDAARVMYFNSEPVFDMLEIRLPLPADDAAWDANTASGCAAALGLHGPVAACDSNREGSRRPKQPEMHQSIKALLHQTYDIQPGTTNLYSKFILIHALHVQLYVAQRQTSQDQTTSFPSSGNSTPISQVDWVTRGVDGAASSGSGHATPVEGASATSPQQMIKSVNNAFDKWKRAWDDDMAIQYPPASQHHHRFGFCRDAVHFYWLAKYLMQNNRVLDWGTPPDQRFSQVMHILTFVKTWVVSDSAKRGEELGSVSDIDRDYGVTDLTLDMAQLFKPINKLVDSPVAGVHTNI